MSAAADDRFTAIISDPKLLAQGLKAIGLTGAQREALIQLHAAPRGLPAEVDAGGRVRGPTVWQCSRVGTLLTRHFAGIGPRDAMMWIGFVREGPRDTIFWCMRPTVAQALESLGWVTSGLADRMNPEPLKRLPKPDAEAMEGEFRLRVHLERERDPLLAKSKRDAMRLPDGSLDCEACGANSARLFPGLERDLWEVHHSKPLSERNTKSPTRLQDLVVLCPTCHRAIHSIHPMPDLSAFRQMFFD